MDEGEWLTETQELLESLVPRKTLRRLIRGLGERPRRDTTAMLAQAEALLCDKEAMLARWWSLTRGERLTCLTLMALSRLPSLVRMRTDRLVSALLSREGARLDETLEILKNQGFLIEVDDEILLPIFSFCGDSPPLPLEQGEALPFPPSPLAELAHRCLWQAVARGRGPSAFEAEGETAMRFLFNFLLDKGVVEHAGDNEFRLSLPVLAEMLQLDEAVQRIELCRAIPQGLPSPPLDERCLLRLLYFLPIYSDGPAVSCEHLLRHLAPLCPEAGEEKVRHSLEQIVEILEALGLAESVGERGVRLQGLQRILWMNRPPTLPAPPPVSVLLEGQVLVLPPRSSSALHSRAQILAELEGVEERGYRYRLSENLIAARLALGETASSLASRWREAGGVLPDTMLALWEERERHYGTIRLYVGVEWLSVRDPLTLRELQLTLPELRAWSVGRVTPTDLLLEERGADPVLRALRERGYLPQEEEE